MYVGWFLSMFFAYIEEWAIDKQFNDLLSQIVYIYMVYGSQYRMIFVFVVDARKTKARSHAHKMGILSSIRMCFLENQVMKNEYTHRNFFLILVVLQLYMKCVLFCYSSEIWHTFTNAHTHTSHIPVDKVDVNINANHILYTHTHRRIHTLNITLKFGMHLHKTLTWRETLSHTHTHTANDTKDINENQK